MSSTDPERPWFHAGLAFECTRCGACCTGAPGFVWVNLEEMTRLAAHRGEPLEVFTRQFVRRVGDHHSLTEKPGGDCVFWDRQSGCTVYPARPIQCQTWPFWPENLESRDAWEQVQRVCPGSRSGRFFSAEEVLAASARIHTE